MRSFCECTNHFRGNMQEENGADEGEGQDEHNEGITIVQTKWY